MTSSGGTDLARETGQAAEKARGQGSGGYFRWGFFSASAVILMLVLAGEMLGRLLTQWPPVRALMAQLRGLEAPPVLAHMGTREWILAGFLFSATGYVLLQRHAVGRFFRSMHVGVSLVSLTTLAVILGVLVPQIQNFEDRDEHVNAANYESNYSEFRWAEAYFLYHLVRPYGIGMPKPDAAKLAAAREGLKGYAAVYGEEEAGNRRKLMEASFTGSEKSDRISAFARRNDARFRKAFDIATALQLNRLFKSNWFASLLFLVATGVLYNTFKGGWRRWFTVGKVGFFVTHAGILIMLAGGFVSTLFTDRGLLNLYLDRGAEDTYFRHYNQDKLARMPFAVRLDHFARKEWKALEVWPLQDDLNSRVPRYTLWEGREIPFDYGDPAAGAISDKPRMKLRVKELYDHARVAFPKIREGDAMDGGGALPGIELEVPNVASHSLAHRAETMMEEGPTRRIFLSPMSRSQAYSDPQERFRLVAVHDAEPSVVLGPELDRVLGTLDIELQGSRNPLPVSVRFKLGERIQLAGGWEIEVVDATKDLQKSPDREAAMRGSQDKRPLALQPDGFAAVWVDIHPPDGEPEERRVVVEVLDPIEYGLQREYENKQVVVRLRWDRWTAPGPARHVLSWGPGRAATLTSESGDSVQAVAGKPLQIAGVDVTPLGFYEHARFEQRLDFLPNETDAEGWDRSFYKRDARGLVVDVITDPGTAEERVEEVRMATSRTNNANVWITPDQRFALKFIENDEGFPFDWRSVLSIEEVDGTGRAYTVPLGAPKKREIRVNDYFKYKGYRFFQTNADAMRPNYSGIGVVYDPGIPLVLIGMYTIIAGACLAFLFRPIVLARRRREAQAS